MALISSSVFFGWVVVVLMHWVEAKRRGGREGKVAWVEKKDDEEQRRRHCQSSGRGSGIGMYLNSRANIDWSEPISSSLLSRIYWSENLYFSCKVATCISVGGRVFHFNHLYRGCLIEIFDRTMVFKDRIPRQWEGVYLNQRLLINICSWLTVTADWLRRICS